MSLVLGPIVLDDFEVASGVRYGGRQRLVTHDLPGGTRVIDALGRDDSPIVFTGVFSGADATARARVVDTLRASGAVLPLVWDAYFYSIVIQALEAEYANPWWIPFRLTCAVLRDEAASVIGAVVDAAASVIGDVGAAAADSLGIGIDLSSVMSAVGVTGAATLGTAAYATAVGAVTGGLASLRSPPPAPSFDPSEPAPADMAAAGVGGNVAAAGTLAVMANAAGYLGRAARNLMNAGT